MNAIVRSRRARTAGSTPRRVISARSTTANIKYSVMMMMSQIIGDSSSSGSGEFPYALGLPRSGMMVMAATSTHAGR